MSRLIVLSARAYDFEDQQTRRQVVGRTVWAIDPDSVDESGAVPVKLSQAEAKFFPKALAVYEVTYEPRMVGNRRQLVVSGARYVEDVDLSLYRRDEDIRPLAM